MDKIYHIGGCVKLAKLWERHQFQAFRYHNDYYQKKYADSSDSELIGVYIDITGNKQTYKRPKMVSLIRDCTLGEVNCIATQTKAYLAANTEELCFLLYFLFHLPVRIDIVSEDDPLQIDTIRNPDMQREALLKMADDYVALNMSSFREWESKLREAMNRLVS